MRFRTSTFTVIPAKPRSGPPTPGQAGVPHRGWRAGLVPNPPSMRVEPPEFPHPGRQVRCACRRCGAHTLLASGERLGARCQNCGDGGLAPVDGL